MEVYVIFNIEKDWEYPDKKVIHAILDNKEEAEIFVDRKIREWYVSFHKQAQGDYEEAKKRLEILSKLSEEERKLIYNPGNMEWLKSKAKAGFEEYKKKYYMGGWSVETWKVGLSK